MLTCQAEAAALDQIFALTICFIIFLLNIARVRFPLKITNIMISKRFVHYIKPESELLKKYLTGKQLSVEFKLLQCNIFVVRDDCTQDCWTFP